MPHNLGMYNEVLAVSQFIHNHVLVISNLINQCSGTQITCEGRGANRIREPEALQDVDEETLPPLQPSELCRLSPSPPAC
jgi:hypothetical protein